jgi:hypothetical protein
MKPATKKVVGIVLMVIGSIFSILSVFSMILQILQLRNEVAAQQVFLEGHEPFYIGVLIGLTVPILLGIVGAVIGFFLYRSSTKGS